MTVFTKIEHAVKSRPLTFVSVNLRDGEALTPNHFLIDTSSGQLNLGRFDSLKLSVRKQWQMVQHFADAFWKICKKWHVADEPLKVNHIVPILDTDLDRYQWRKGVVSRILLSSDGEV